MKYVRVYPNLSELIVSLFRRARSKANRTGVRVADLYDFEGFIQKYINDFKGLYIAML